MPEGPHTVSATLESQLKTELDEANRRVAELYKMASLGRLLASVVHEINTPISSIFTNNEVILRSLEKLRPLLARPDGAASNPKVSEIVETIQSLSLVDKIACERISSVIRSLKTFSRVDESDLRKVDLHEILRDTLKLSGCEFRRRVEVETDFGELPPVECYPHLLNQVFINLLINAGQAIEGEGKVTVKTRLEGDEVHVAIGDTGRGIKPENRSKIFAPGFTTKPLGVGTGLGLAISRKIVVETHGGSIDFETEEGVGTTFHVRIPIRRRETGGN
jgi:two-component system, NtrC family, sensor kinase